MRTAGLHHVAYACRDLAATTHFYEDLLGYPLVHTEVQRHGPDGVVRHIFHDLGDGSAIAFFQFANVGERPDWDSAVSTGNGLPVWVNHVAFAASAERQEEVRRRMADEGIAPLMELDHGWCHSLYYLDPNGIMVELTRDAPGFTPDPDRAHALLATDPDEASGADHPR